MSTSSNARSTAADTAPRARTRRLYGRRKGPRLSPRKEALLAEHLPRYRIDPRSHASGRLDPARLFPQRPDRCALEIGFGKGEHLVACAVAAPETGFIGCEPYLNGLAALMDAIDHRGGLDNVRVYDGDARDVLDVLRPASLAAVHLIHPDPWPKRRHAKRRFVNGEDLDRIARVLAPGGEFLVVTDHPVYVAWTAAEMARHADFLWLAERAADWRTPPPDWHATRYARKAADAGRHDRFLRYRRIG